MTGFQYRYVGGIGVEVRGKKTTEKKRVFRFRVFGATEKPTLKSQGKNRPKKTESVFRLFFFSSNQKTDFKKSVFGREKTRKNDRNNDFRFSVHNPDCGTYSSTW